MELLTTVISRILFSVPFIIFGVMHFTGGEGMADMVPLPGGIFWIYLSGAALIAAGVAIIIKKMGWLASVLLALLLIVFALSVHLPGVINAADDQSMQLSMTNMLKDLALAGGALGFGYMFDKEEGVVESPSE